MINQWIKLLLIILTAVLLCGCQQESSDYGDANFSALTSEWALSPEKFGENILRMEYEGSLQEERILQWEKEYQSHPENQQLAEKIKSEKERLTALNQKISLFLKVVAATSAE